MKTELLQNVKAQPYTSAAAIDRKGFNSAVLAVLVGTPTGSPTALTLGLTFTECDTDSGVFTAVKDKAILVEKALLDSNGAISFDTDAEGGDMFNFDIDLSGCKRYVKITIAITCTGGTSPTCSTTNAIVLGDSIEQPV